MIVLYIIHLVAIFFLVMHALAWTISLFKKSLNARVLNKKRKFATIITAYKNVTIAEPLIASLVKQIYEDQEIFLVADHCDAEKAKILADQYNITLIVPEQPFNSKIKSINAVVSRLDLSFDAVVILDPDNLAHPYFIKKINDTMNCGFDAVQGQRTAKNLDTAIACLDALGEFYYNVNTRLIPFQIGSSATIAGSGMAIALPLFKNYLKLEALNETLGKVVIAEDKILQTYIVSLGKTIAYTPEAIVYDEKIATANQLQRQRTRWINTWFKHAGEGFKLFHNVTWNKTWFALLTLYPPMFLQAIVAALLLLVDLLIFPEMAVAVLVALVIYVAHFVHSLAIAKVPTKVIYSLTSLPIFFYKQVVSFTQMKKSNHDFMHTEHNKSITIEDINC